MEGTFLLLCRLVLEYLLFIKYQQLPSIFDFLQSRTRNVYAVRSESTVVVISLLNALME
jgi:hypothetical protein